MKHVMVRIHVGWTIWLLVSNILYAVRANLDDLDFTDLNSDQQHEPDRKSVAEGVVKAAFDAATVKSHTSHNNFIPLDEDWDHDFETPVKEAGYAFQYREKMLRKALSKALKNVTMRQRFLEIMPILRVLSPTQRLALSALINAQMAPNTPQRLKLEEVRSMFGDDKETLLPIMFDIANLVSSSAFNFLPREPKPAEVIDTFDRREYELNLDETKEEDQMLGIASDFSEEILDSKSINDKLMEPMPQLQRRRRSIGGEKLIHKLERAVPLSILTEEELQKEYDLSRTLKSNTTRLELDSFESSTESVATGSNYREINDDDFSQLNASLSENTATDLPTTINEDTGEALPTPEGLISGSHYRLHPKKIRPIRQKAVESRKRVQIQARPKTGLASEPLLALPKKCERFTSSMYIYTDDYPLDQIMGSIRRHKNAMTALLAEHHDNSIHGLKFGKDFDDFLHNKKRREDEGGLGGGMCRSVVRYARPQKARSASGEWKYIVNTGQHTQTLRLEKCTNAQESCSYLAQNYRSHCTQVYNYHRLLSWDKTRGLHVDIYKVPTCCTCQVDGYRQMFPPLSNLKEKDFTPLQVEPYSTINAELDYNDDEDDQDLNYHLSANGVQSLNARDPHDFDINELQSGNKKVRKNAYPPSPTVGSYLSPPENENFETPYGYQSASPINGKNLLVQKSTKRRRPYESISDNAVNEARGDLEIAPSELHGEKEVKPFGNALPKVWKSIYYVPHIKTGTSGSSSSDSRLSGTSLRPFSTQTTGGHFTHQAANSNTSYTGSSSGRGRRQPQTTWPVHTPYSQTSVHTSTSTGSHGFATSSSIDSHTSTTKPAKINVNVMYTPNHNTSSGSKRINYNYHPIIDFFEVNTRRTTTTQPPLTSRYAYDIPKIARENYKSHKARMDFSSPNNAHPYLSESSAWLPLVKTN